MIGMRMPVRNAAWTIILLAVFGAIPSCDRPLSVTDRDLVELERVWQFLKVYSIWQEQIPPDPFAFRDPVEMLTELPDTLYDNNSYTQYWPVAPYWLSDEANGSAEGAAENPDSSVRWTPITATTVLVRIDRFQKRPFSTSSELAAIPDNSPNVVLDLRHNPGGNVDVCTSAVELFLPFWKPYISATYRRYNDTTRDTATVRNETWRSRHTGDRFEKRKYAVLIDSGSASAAEIFAAALRDGLGPDTVLTIGSRTYGKGIGQYIVHFRSTSGAAMQITGFRFRRITGIDSVDDYNKRGIAPDVTCPDDSILTVLAHWFGDSALIPVKTPLPDRLGPRLMKTGCYREIAEDALP